jgi:hypothetical protein
MANFTSDEVEAAVEQLVQGTIRKPYDVLGTRRTDVTFGDVQTAVAGVFILYPLAPFYCVYLGTQRSLDLVTSEALVVGRLLEAVGSLGRLVLPVEDLTPLFNAKAALEALQGAVKSGAPADITKLPQYQRFTSNVDSFLNGPASAVKDGGAIVPTPDEARANIPGLMRQLQEAHGQLVQSATLLSQAIADFIGVNLSALVASGIISKATTVLDGHAQDLQAMSAQDRLAALRQPVLDLLTAKAVIRTFGSFAGPSDLFTIVGEGFPYSDATHLATPATLVGDVRAPFNVTTGSNDTLTFVMDGAPSFSVRLPPSFYAVLGGTVPEFPSQEGGAIDGYLIGDGTLPLGLLNPVPNNSHLRLLVTSRTPATSTTVDVTLTASTSSHAVAIGTGDSTTWTYGIGGSFDGEDFRVTIDDNALITINWVIPPVDEAAMLALINTALGSQGTAAIVGNRIHITSASVGQSSKVLIGSSSAQPIFGFAPNTLFTGSVNRRTAQQVCDDINAAFTSAGMGTKLLAEPYFFPGPNFQGNVAVVPTTGSTAQFNSIVPGTTSFAAVKVGDILSIVSGPNADTWDVASVVSVDQITAVARSVTPSSQSTVAVAIGPRDRYIRVRAIDPSTISGQWSIKVLGDTTVSAAGAQTLGFAVGFVVSCTPLQPSDVVDAVNRQATKVTVGTVMTDTTPMPLLSDTTDPQHVVASRILGSGTLVFTHGSPNSITITSSSSFLEAGVEVGDTLVLRGQGNTTWTITVVTGSTVTATSTSSATSGVSTFQIGPTFAALEWQTLQINSPPNSGNYLVDGVGDSPLDILLKQRTPIPHFANQADLQPIVMPDALLGDEVLAFSSKNQTITSSVIVSGSAVPLFFIAPPTIQRGTTPFFLVPKPTAGGLPTGGDLLQLYATDYTTPSDVFTVTTVDAVSNGLILGIDPDVQDFPTSWTFNTQPTPFATLRRGHVVDFGSFKTAVESWLAKLPNQTSYFSQLNRVINPLLANKNPTPAQIGDAVNGVVALAELLAITEAQAQNTDPTLTIESIFKSYLVDPITPIDALVKTYKQKGSDRALDILLGGQFQSFFGLTADESSYAGAVQSTMRSVAQNDLAIRKGGRTSAVNSHLRGSSVSPDYEFSKEDVETGLKPDAPADFEKS